MNVDKFINTADQLPADKPFEVTVSDEVSDETLKVQINNLIWMFGPKEMTLGEADDLACNMFDAFRSAEAKVNERTKS